MMDLTGSRIGPLFANNRFAVEDRYFKALKRARFLSKSEKRQWIAMGSYLSVEELLEAEEAILNEDLRALDVKQKLHQLKPKAA